MAVYDIAGLRVEMKNNTGRTAEQAAAYLSENQEIEDIDIVIDVTEERIRNAIREHPELNHGDWEYMLTGSDFYTELLRYNGFLLHSSCVVVDDKAYAFSADSGVGKSTHTNLWLQHFGDRAHIINDDKPAIRLIDGKVYACGTPWSGKYDYSTPEMVELIGICFLSRGRKNHIRRADTGQAVFNIFSQTVRKLNEDKMNNLFDVIETVFDKVPLFEMMCNISDDAVTTAYEAMCPSDFKRYNLK